MKRSGKILFTVVLLLAALVPAGVYAALHLPHIAVTPSAPSVAVGEEFTVTVANKEMQVCSYTGGITFDTNILEVLEIAQGDAPVYREAVCGLSSAAEANATGKIGLYAVHKEEAAYQGGTLLTVTFRARQAGTAVLTPYEDCDGTEAFRLRAGRCEIAIGGGEGVVSLQFRLVKADSTLTLKKDDVTVWSCASAPAGEYAIPIATGTYLLEVARTGDYTRPYPVNTASGTSLGDVSSICWGDVNGNGETDATDLQNLYEYLSVGRISGTLDTATFRGAADVNSDGAINILDYQYLYEILVAGTQTQMAAPALQMALPPVATMTQPATPTQWVTATDVATPADIATSTDGGETASPTVLPSNTGSQ